MKSRGFTLIELLVVAYNGYTKSAKTAVVKANEKTIIKFVQLTLQRCDIEGGLIQIEGLHHQMEEKLIAQFQMELMKLVRLMIFL